jgi:predicted peptidase
MRVAVFVAFSMLLGYPSAAADTGFLDRSVTVGGVAHRYQVYVPAEHSRNKTWPVVIDLHGNGAQGQDGLLQTAQGMADQIRFNRSRFPALVLFPQAGVDKRWFDADMEELVITELDRTMKEFGGDPARVYLTGFSMGATGAYRIAYRWPDRFAAIAAVAGRVTTADAAGYSDSDKEADRKSNPFVSAADPFAALAEKIRHLAIRIFHGDADEVVPVEQSRRFVGALKAAQANVNYQEYAGDTHVAAAQKAYADEGLVSWLLAQHR